jgi:hypothetical protein
MERKINRYILAAKRNPADLESSLEIVRGFPGFVVVAESNHGIITVEASAKSMAAFRKSHAREFLIEAPKERSLPDKPFAALVSSIGS